MIPPATGSSFEEIELCQSYVSDRPTDPSPHQQNDNNPAQHSTTAITTYALQTCCVQLETNQCLRCDDKQPLCLCSMQVTEYCLCCKPVQPWLMTGTAPQMGLGGQICLLVAKQHFHSFIDRHLLLVGEGDKRIQVVNLTFNQSVHCPKDRVQVRKPHPARDI